MKKHFAEQRNESKREKERRGELREMGRRKDTMTVVVLLGVGRSIFMRARLIAFTSINALAVTSITCDRNNVVNIVLYIQSVPEPSTDFLA